MLVAGIAIAATLRSSGWSLTALPRVDSKTRLGAVARGLDPGFRTVHPGAYDGQFYWGIAVDPLARGNAHKAFDKASYRYGHPLYGWLAWLLSAGRARAVPAALVVIGLAALFAAATIAAVIGLGRGGSGWEGLFVALNPGLIISAAQDLAEPLATALMLAAFAAHARGRPATTWACLALLPLVKEPLGLVLAAVVGWELVHRHREQAAIFATAVIPALLWWTYDRIHLGAWFTSGDSALGRPLGGWWSAFFGSGVGSHGSVFRHGAAVAALIALIALLAVAGVRALRLRSPVAVGYVGLAAVVVCLAPNAVAEFSTALRNTAFLVALVPFVLASPALRPGRRPDRPLDRPEGLSSREQ